MYPIKLLARSFKDPLFAGKKIQRLLAHRVDDKLRLLAYQKSLSETVNREEIVNRKEIRVIGLKRTGNHAIINWIENQQGGCVLHLNNIPVDENPYRFTYEYIQDNYGRHQTAIKHILSYPQYQEQGIKQIQREAAGDFIKKDCLLYSYEDYSLKRLSRERSQKMHDIYFGKSGETFDVLILRDPFNWLASRFKKNYMSVKTWNLSVIDLWIEYAKEYLGETQHLGDRKKVFINYNQWVSSQDYRKKIAKNLELEFTDAGIDEVGRFGGGSSFDNKNFSRQASEMNVLGRWQAFADDKAYLSMLKNKNIFDYSKQIFGDIPGTEALLKKLS